MKPRMEISALAPAAYKAMLALEKYLDQSPLPQPLQDLVKLRASQLNGCAYCVDMHSFDAKKGGESDERLFAVAAWREGPFFTERERAALELTEAATRLGEHGVPDEVWERAKQHFDEQTLAALVVAIATINAWNRFGVTTRMVPESFRGLPGPTLTATPRRTGGIARSRIATGASPTPVRTLRGRHGHDHRGDSRGDHRGPYGHKPAGHKCQTFPRKPPTSSPADHGQLIAESGHRGGDSRRVSGG